MSRGAAVADASWGGRTDGVGLRVDHRPSGSVSVWQADRELSETGAVGGVQRRAATAGTHHETGQLSVALLRIYDTTCDTALHHEITVT